MSTTSTNLGLTLPALDERLSLSVLNQNWNLIDAFAGTVNNKLFPLGNAQSITAATDFNDLVGIKNYVITSNAIAAACDNCPSASAGKLCTWSIGGGTFDATWQYGGQIYFDITGKMFRRTMSTNGSAVLSFGTWEQLATGNITEYSGTKNDTYISAIEGRVTKYGRMVSGYLIVTVGTSFSAADTTFVSGLPAANNQYVQLPCICLSGTDIYKASRVRITTNGTITTWYGFGLNSGASYLIPVNYICA